MARLLITGATGFLGSALCREAVAAGHEVFGVGRDGHAPARVAEGVTFRSGGSMHGDDLTEALGAIAPDLVIHCAGATPRSHLPSRLLWDANVRLTWDLLSALAQTGFSGVCTVVSSAAVYGSSAPVPTAEDSPHGPDSHYGWTKSVAERVAAAFIALDGVRVNIARPFNLIGDGEPAGSVVSDVLQQLASATREIEVRETDSVRDFLDVRDAATALLAIVEHGGTGEAYNVCSGRGVSVDGLVGEMKRAFGSTAPVTVTGNGPAPTVSTGSPARLAALGWSPRYSLPDTLADMARSLTREE